MCALTIIHYVLNLLCAMVGHHFVAKYSRVWHPNTQMSEWGGFVKITNGKGMYLYDSRGRGQY